MSDPLRERLDAAAPAIEKMKADLPPVVFVICTPNMTYNDEYYYPEDGLGQIAGVFLSRLDAERELPKHGWRVDANDLSEDVNRDDLEPDGSYIYGAWIEEHPLQ